MHGQRVLAGVLQRFLIKRCCNLKGNTYKGIFFEIYPTAKGIDQLVTSLLSTQGTSHIRNVQEGEHSEAYEFFYNDNGNDGIYKTLYNDCINTIAKEYHANLKLVMR